MDSAKRVNSPLMASISLKRVTFTLLAGTPELESRTGVWEGEGEGDSEADS